MTLMIDGIKVSLISIGVAVTAFNHFIESTWKSALSTKFSHVLLSIYISFHGMVYRKDWKAPAHVDNTCTGRLFAIEKLGMCGRELYTFVRTASFRPSMEPFWKQEGER